MKKLRELTYNDKIDIEVESIANQKDLCLNLTREKFEKLCKDKFNLILEPIKEVLAKSKVNKNDIDEIVLVGGSTRIPKIQSILTGFFNGKKLNQILNPDEAVAYGATIEAAIQMGKYDEDILLLDVCPFSLGLAVHNNNEKDKKKNGRLMKKIIKKGSKLPFKTNQMFHPSHNNLNIVSIEVYEGENKYVKDNYYLGKFQLLEIPKNLKKEKINIDITFELDVDSILTVSADIKGNNCTNSLVIKNDKGGLSQNEIEKAKEKHNKYSIWNKGHPSMIIERNYKKEINNLINKINNETNSNEQFLELQKLQNNIENFIDFFDKNIFDNDTLREKKYLYLKYLFNTYSCLFNYKLMLSNEEKENMISKVKNYLEIFNKKGTCYCPSLVKIFIENDDFIFGEFCIQILGYYSQKGTYFYYGKNNKYSKYYLEEAISISEKFLVEERVKNNREQYDKLKLILGNCKELINILKAESIEKYCKNFSKYILIDENEFITEEQKLDILDRFKEALKYLKNPIYKEDKLLKAIYLANIVKIEYKMFQSNNYDILLKMIEDSINLKLQVPQSCHTSNLNWFKELCDIKLEIQEEQKEAKLNPLLKIQKLKDELKNIITEINNKFKEGKIIFLFYILSHHKPIGLEDNFKFNNIKDLENAYNSNKKEFMKKIRRYYYPIKYNGYKGEEQKTRYIMNQISMKLNSIKEE